MLPTKVTNIKGSKVENKSKQLPFMYVTQHKQWWFRAHSYCTGEKKIVQNFDRFLGRCTNKLRTNKRTKNRYRKGIKLILNAFNGQIFFRFVSLRRMCLRVFMCEWKLHTKLAGKQRPFMCNKIRANFAYHWKTNPNSSPKTKEQNTHKIY